MMNDRSDKDGTPDERPTPPKGSQSHQNPPSWSIPDSGLWQVFESLSEREQRIIGLVAHGYSSKEIGTLENDSENAIEQVVKRVRARCGGTIRRELMRSYIAWENARFQSLGGDLPAMRPAVDADRFPVDRLAALHGDTEDGPQPPSVHRDDADAGTDPSPRPRGMARPVQMVLRLPVGIDGSGRNDLRKHYATFVIVLIALVSVMFAGSILSLLHSADSVQIGH